jgi:hypothetical protein
VALHGDAAGREVGTGHDFGQFGGRGVGSVQQQLAGVDQFADIVRRDRGRHADGDARRAVGQKVGEAGRQDRGLLALVVVGGAEIDRVLVDALHQDDGGRGQLALGVAHGGGVIAVDVAEVSLTVDQRIALREVLREADQSVVDRGVAVRVIGAHDVAHDLGAFPRRGLRVQAHLVHRVHDAAVHRLEAVAHVRKGAVGDGRQGVGQIAAAQRRLHGLVDDTAALGGRRRVEGHAGSNQPVWNGSLVRDRPGCRL